MRTSLDHAPAEAAALPNLGSWAEKFMWILLAAPLFLRTGQDKQMQ